MRSAPHKAYQGRNTRKKGRNTRKKGRNTRKKGRNTRKKGVTREKLSTFSYFICYTYTSY